MLKFTKLLLTIVVLIILFGCNDNSLVNESDQNNLEVYTTVERTIVPLPVPENTPVIYPYEISKFSQYGYGKWQFGPGLPYQKRYDLMPSSYNTALAVNQSKLLNFFAFSDVHIMDEETPAQAIYFGYKGTNPSAYSATMLYTVQMLDAAVRTVNGLHKKNKFDFGIALGDNTNSNQYNEARLFIDVLDGNYINPDSGVKDDPVRGPNNDYQDAFKPEGLDNSIPWYQVLGNHDHLWLGVYPTNSYLKPYYTGENILDMGDLFTDPRGIESRGIYGGAIDGRTVNGDIIGAGPVSDFPSQPKVPAADNNRRAISKEEWKTEYTKSATLPAGHGLSQQSTILGCYSFEPKSDFPLKVIVIDDTQPYNDFDLYEQGYMDNERFNWLIGELDKGQAEGKLMVIASHIPLIIIGYHSHSPVSLATLVNKLYSYPNLIMWIAGHIHRNNVIAFKSPVAAKPESGFWHVETASLRDFPQQFRTFKIVRNSDNNISVFVTNVDPVLKEGYPVYNTRSYAIATSQIMKIPYTNLTYNAELVVPLSPEMQNKIKNLGTPLTKK